jgi:hypothetical protein
VTSTVLTSNVAVITSSALAGTFCRRWRAARARTGPTNEAVSAQGGIVRLGQRDVFPIRLQRRVCPAPLVPAHVHYGPMQSRTG